MGSLGLPAGTDGLSASFVETLVNYCGLKHTLLLIAGFTWHPLRHLPSQAQLFLPPGMLRIFSLVPQTDRGEGLNEAAAALGVHSVASE